MHLELGGGCAVTFTGVPGAADGLAHESICSLCLEPVQRVTEVLTLKLGERPAWATDAPKAAPHHCHARGCKVDVSPKLLMCPRHWRMVPPDMQRAVWRAYVHGQEERKDPSDAWMRAADRAIGHVAMLEGRA